MFGHGGGGMRLRSLAVLGVAILASGIGPAQATVSSRSAPFDSSGTFVQCNDSGCGHTASSDATTGALHAAASDGGVALASVGASFPLAEPATQVLVTVTFHVDQAETDGAANSIGHQVDLWLSGGDENCGAPGNDFCGGGTQEHLASRDGNAPTAVTDTDYTLTAILRREPSGMLEPGTITLTATAVAALSGGTTGTDTIDATVTSFTFEPNPASSQTTAQAVYAAAPAPIAGLVPECLTAIVGVGTVCFPVELGAQFVGVATNDFANGHAASTVDFLDANGNLVVRDVCIRESRTLMVPSIATTVVVRTTVSEWCAPPTTVGTISTTFTHYS